MRHLAAVAGAVAASLLLIFLLPLLGLPNLAIALAVGTVIMVGAVPVAFIMRRLVSSLNATATLLMIVILAATGIAVWTQQSVMHEYLTEDGEIVHDLGRIGPRFLGYWLPLWVFALLPSVLAALFIIIATRGDRRR